MTQSYEMIAPVGHGNAERVADMKGQIKSTILSLGKYTPVVMGSTEFMNVYNELSRS